MKVLLSIYAKYTHDARALETIDALSLFSDVIVVSFDRLNDKKIIHYTTKKQKKNYFSFIICFFEAYKKERPDVVFLHDNYCAPLIPIIRRINPKQIIIYDSSELYYDKSINSITSLVGRSLQNYEEKYLPQVDGVFAANIERARIMYDRFHLKEIPQVFDNIHRIIDQFDTKEMDRKFSSLLDAKHIILYCGGISEKRRTFELIDAVKELGKDYKLIIAGSVTDKDLIKFEKMKDNSPIINCEYIGYLDRSDIRYLLQKCEISVSLFDYSCVNNIFCASGKVYESLFEGTPVLVSTNPPLKRLCDDYRVGVSTDDFKEGIKKIVENYDYYMKNVLSYCSNLDYDNRIKRFSEQIKDFIRKSGLAI